MRFYQPISRYWRAALILLALVTLNAYGDAPYYSVQVKAAPLKERADALELYRMLKTRGYLVYHYVTPIEQQMWVRVRVGVFDSRAEAESFGQTLAEHEGLDYFVSRAPVRVRESGGARLVMTPSGAWISRDVERRLLFSTGTQTVSQMVDYSADISPSGDRVAAMHDDALVVYDVASGNVVLRKDELGSIMPRIRYSPDGQWLAFQPVRDFEGEFSLWLMPAVGGEPRRVIDMTGTQQTIRSFAWHPREPRLFYVEGQAYGAVSQGGRIMLTDLDGNTEVFLAPQGEREELAGELDVRDGRLHYRVIRFDENYNHYAATPGQAEIP